MAAGTSNSSPSNNSTTHNHHSAAGGKAANGLSANGMNSTNHYSPIHSTHPHAHPQAHGHPHQHQQQQYVGAGPSGVLDDGLGAEDGDNRTRNAKAQRRHREKRKAHLKALEESVQVLTAQLEDARRQLGQAAYFSQPGNRPPNSPLSPSSKDLSQLQAENAYLRDENADLRRQLYTYRATYGHPPPPPPGEEIKSEQAGFAYPNPPGTTSPRRRPNEVNTAGGADASVPSTADGPSSATSSNTSYAHMDQFTPIQGNGERSRSRVMSSSSAPSASPYLHSDPRSVDARYPGGQPMRYEAQPGMYSAPGAHQIPRYDVPQGSHHPYATRQDAPESVSWPPESGPPPFSSYPMGFAHEGGSDEWRPEH